MNYLPAITAILVVVILVMTAWLFATMDGSKKLLLDQIEDQRLQVLRMESEIKRLTTIIASKDPMTYQTLSLPPTVYSNSEPTDAYLTDEEEARQWAIRTGKIDPDGHLEDDDVADDLRMLGI